MNATTQETLINSEIDNTQTEILSLQTICLSVAFILMSLALCLIPKIWKDSKVIKYMIKYMMRYSKPLMGGFLIPLIFFDSLLHMIPHSHENDENQVLCGLFVSVCSISILFLIDLFLMKKMTAKHQSCDDNVIKDVHKDSYQEIGSSNVLTLNCRASIIDIERQNSHHESAYHGQDECCNTEVIGDTSTALSAFIYIFVISIHAFFEGLGFKSSGSMGSYEIGISIHKILETLFVVIALNESRLDYIYVVLLSIFFSILTPLGMILGSFLKNMNLFIFGFSAFTICQGLSLGSLIYIAFVKMLAPMIKKEGSNIIDICLFVVSTTLTTIFFMLTPHSH